MWKFFLGALVVFLYYNQANVRRGYYIVVREFHVARRAIEADKPRVIKALRAPSPQLKTTVEVQEPTLDQLESLGFVVERQ